MNEARKQRCIQIAKNLKVGVVKKPLHFSFILKKNKLLVTAANDYVKRHPSHIFGEYKPTRKGNKREYIAGTHSEVAAIKQFLNKFGSLDFSGLTLFNVRLAADGRVALAKPCLNCSRVLETMNFKKIVWTEN